MTDQVAIPRYALLECERRWLVEPAALPVLNRAEGWLIEDRYFAATRLRLRRMTPLAADPAGVVHKLCKKYPGPAGAGPITNLYLTADEYSLLAALPGDDLRKTRLSIMRGAERVSIDLFSDELSGLVIAEIEAATPAAAAVIAPPAWAGPEITAHPELIGAALALRSFADLEPVLAALWTGDRTRCLSGVPGASSPQ